MREVEREVLDNRKIDDGIKREKKKPRKTLR